MYIVYVPHPQPHLDILGVKPVKLRRLLHSFSSVVGCEKKGTQSVNLLPRQSHPDASQFSLKKS